MCPLLTEDDLDFISHSEIQTRRLGERLGVLLQPGDVICLEGPLGGGKTCFTQGIGQGLGITGLLSSPTYTIVNEYHTQKGISLYHIDFYRLSNSDFPGFDITEYIGGSGIAVVEWPERGKDYLPDDRLWITFRHVAEMKRGLLLRAQGERGRELLRAFRRSAFGV